MITSPREIMQNTFFLPFPFLFIYLFIKWITKTTYHEIHECYAMQILKKKLKEKQKKKQKQKQQKENGHKEY